MNMLTEWWGGLDLTLQIFYALGIFSGAILLIQTLLMLLGVGDGDMDMDSDVDLDHGDGGGLLSVRTIVAFLFGFGWTGALCHKSGLNITLTLLIAFAVGMAMMFIIFGLMRFLYSMRQDGTINYNNAIGEIGTVYLPIPGGGKTPGKVEVMVQGRLVVAEAFHQGDEKLENHSKVKIINTAGGNSLIVEPLA